MISIIIKNTEKKMNKSLNILINDLLKIRAGKAHPNILMDIKVNYYGTKISIFKLSNITIIDSNTLKIIPWEKFLLIDIEKAILSSNLGLNPINMGDSLIIPIPSLNEERRKELVRLIKSKLEFSKISVRNIRRDANSNIKDLLKKRFISKDEAKIAESSIQKITDKIIIELNNIYYKKKEELISF